MEFGQFKGRKNMRNWLQSVENIIKGAQKETRSLYYATIQLGLLGVCMQ